VQISEPAEGVLRNLSLEGLAIETSSIMVDGLHISYNIHPSRKNRVYLQWALPSGRVIKAVGETIWYERTSASKPAFVVGLRIREIAPEDYNALKNFIRESQGDRPLSI